MSDAFACPPAAGVVLLVEDEETVRVVAASRLRQRGYQVLEAAGGDEALALAQANAGRIDLMVVPVILTGMDGVTLVRQARPYLGKAPATFSSSYAGPEMEALLNA